MAETVTGRAHPALPSAARRVFRGYSRGYSRVSCLQPCWCCALFRMIPARLRRGRQVHLFLMSGRGDASLIRTESGCVLIDTGTNLSGGYAGGFAGWLGVRRIDCLIDPRA